MLPAGGPLNGRRWAGGTLMRHWCEAASTTPMALASANTQWLEGLLPTLREYGFKGPLKPIGLLNPRKIAPWGGLFIPDPSIGRWAQWRQIAGPASFSLIGQIHTLSTPAALGHVFELVTEPIHEWDALICSSTAGRDVVENLIADRQQQLIGRSEGNASFLQSHKPQLPIIPLPLGVRQMQDAAPTKNQARQEINIPLDASVVIWLGRLSYLTKADLWFTYRVLEKAAYELNQEIWFIECGPDDGAENEASLESLRKLCPNIRFVRLGGKNPVSESLKIKALVAADVAISLVDNIQETFGLAVAEAMSLGIPVLASNWDGYRDLVRHGVDGFLIPTKWSKSALDLSFSLGWQQFTAIQSFPAISGALGQLVQVDFDEAVSSLMALIASPALRSAMGRAASIRAASCFEASVVISSYRELFKELDQIRASAPSAKHLSQKTTLTLDPVRAFSGYPSNEKISSEHTMTLDALPEALKKARLQLWQLMLASVPSALKNNLQKDIASKHL